MNVRQLLAVFAAHTPIRDERRQVAGCRCDPARAWTPVEHTQHLIESLAHAAAAPPPAAPPRRLLPAGELLVEHLGCTASFPFIDRGYGPGASVVGELRGIEPVADGRVALTVYEPDLKRVHAYAVKATTWVELTSPAL